MANVKSYTDFPAGQKVFWASKNDASKKFEGEVIRWNQEKEMMAVKRIEDDKVVLIELDRLKKPQGRPKGSTNKATNSQTSNGKSHHQESEDNEIEANELSAENFESIIEALGTMNEMLANNETELERIVSENNQIKATITELISALKGHHASLQDEPSDEEVEVVKQTSKPAPAKPKSLLKKPMMALAEDGDE